MVAVGSETLQTIGNEFPEGPDVFILRCQYTDEGIGIFEIFLPHIPPGCMGKMGAVLHFGNHVVLYVQRLFDTLCDEIIVKVRIGNGDEKVHRNEVVHILRNRMAFPPPCRCHF